MGILAAATAQVYACAGFTSANFSVVFNRQKSIIIWDDKLKVEHFIRDAGFTTGAPDLGFVAPTPTQPEIAECTSKGFDILDALAPKPRASAGGGQGGGGFGGGGFGGGVQVLEEKDVAGYHAAVLKSADAKALGDWLQSNATRLQIALENGSRVTFPKGGISRPLRCSTRMERLRPEPSACRSKRNDPTTLTSFRLTISRR